LEKKENEENEPTVDKLIAIEWDLLNDLKKMLSNATAQGEKIRLSNAVAYHAIVLNKLLAQKGQEQAFNEDTLGDFVGRHNAEGRMRRAIRRDFRNWKKKLSSTE
jgi:hypothetical protein